jgi:hypothetical protein
MQELVTRGAADAEGAKLLFEIVLLSSSFFSITEDKKA